MFNPCSLNVATDDHHIGHFKIRQQWSSIFKGGFLPAAGKVGSRGGGGSSLLLCFLLVLVLLQYGRRGVLLKKNMWSCSKSAGRGEEERSNDARAMHCCSD